MILSSGSYISARFPSGDRFPVTPQQFEAIFEAAVAAQKAMKALNGHAFHNDLMLLTLALEALAKRSTISPVAAVEVDHG